PISGKKGGTRGGGLVPAAPTRGEAIGARKEMGRRCLQQPCPRQFLGKRNRNVHDYQVSEGASTYRQVGPAQPQPTRVGGRGGISPEWQTRPLPDGTGAQRLRQRLLAAEDGGRASLPRSPDGGREHLRMPGALAVATCNKSEACVIFPEFDARCRK